MAVVAKDSTGLPALTTVGCFSRLPWLVYAVDSVELEVCHLVPAAAGVQFAARHEGEQNDSKHATTPDGPAAVKTAEKSPKYGVRARLFHVERSNSRVQ